jgi:1-phosphatidylinositol-3-phosphate 5-kinase
VRPSSKDWNDSIDFNQFFKIYLLDWPDHSKSKYVNGLIMKRNIANKRMKGNITDPRILLISNSLGNVGEDDNFIDLGQVIRQEEPYVNILISKILAINPNLIFVEKQCTREVQEKLIEHDITVVTSVPVSDIKRISRLTRTIPCSSVNYIDPASF